MTPPGSSPSVQLAQLAKTWRLPDGTTRLVPIIGSGLNVQAARAEGGAPEDDWAGLLQRLARELAIPAPRLRALPRSFIQQWETIVRWYAVREYGYKPFKGEADLQADVCRFLRDLERLTHTYALYRRFASAGFKDILSLNFDRRLALSLGCHEVNSSVPEAELESKRHGRPLYRFSPARSPRGPVRIWYPHGDSKRQDTLKLGVRVYGMYIVALDRVRDRYMQHWYECNQRRGKRGSSPPISVEAWDDLVRARDQRRSWVSVFMSAPLIFIGCGLGDDEWPLWWMLNQRARQTAYLDRPDASRRPDTVVLTAGGADASPRFAGNVCYIRHLHFASYDEMWRAIEGELLG